MKMADACTVQAHSIDRVAAAKEVMAGVQTQAQQIRVGTLAQTRDLFRGFDERACMVMEDRGQSQLTASLGDAPDQSHRAVPLRVIHAVARFIDAPGQGYPF